MSQKAPKKDKDGQQRWTTLYLFHLIQQKQKLSDYAKRETRWRILVATMKKQKRAEQIKPTAEGNKFQ